MPESSSITAILPTMEWIDIELITPHPRNPRYADRSERREAIVRSMQENGFRMDKPLVVRPVPGGYESIGGSTRLTCAQLAGLKQVFCSIEPMTDEAAIIRLAEDNLGDPFNWSEQAIYIAQNAIKDSKLGLSRSRLVQACTGKIGGAAESAAKHQGRSGDVLLELIAEQSGHLPRLFNSSKDLTRHLYEISGLVEYPDREYLVGRLLDESMTIEGIKAAVDGIRRSRIEVTQVTHAGYTPVTLAPPAPATFALREGVANEPPVTFNPTPVAPVSSPAPVNNFTPASAASTPHRLKVAPKAPKLDYNPAEVLGMELQAANDRVDILERFIYKVFNDPKSTIAQSYVTEAGWLGVFAFKYLEMMENVV